MDGRKIILFSSLIPCCQNYERVSSKYIVDSLELFEEESEKLICYLDDSKRKILVEYLLSHPCNRICPNPEFHQNPKPGNLFIPKYVL